MEILKNFGFDPIMLVAQIVNFLIIMFLLKRFLYKPVLDMLKKRQDIISEGLKQAEDARITLEKTLEKEKEILRKAQDEAKTTLTEAKNHAILISKQIENEARKQSEQIIEDSRKQITQETFEAEKRLSGKISSLSIDFLSKSLKEMFSEKTQKEAMEIALKKLKQEN